LDVRHGDAVLRIQPGADVPQARGDQPAQFDRPFLDFVLRVDDIEELVALERDDRAVGDG
jgi:hypothetical protein